MYTVQYFDKVDTGTIRFQKPKKIHTRYRSAARFRDSNGPILVQSPRIQYSLKDDGQHLDILVTDDEFRKFLVSVDELCVRVAHENSESWFGRTFTPDVIRNSYRSPLSVGRSGTHLQAKFQFDEYGEISTRLFDEFANPVDEIVPDGDTIDAAMILELNGFWFGKSAMRCEWSVVQIKQFRDENAAVELQNDSETEEENTFFRPDEIVYDDDDDDST